MTLTTAHASQGDLSPLMLAAAARAVVSRLGVLAVAHPSARAIAHAWVAGAIERADVMTMTGLSEVEYAAGRRRLLSLVADLPPHLREAVKDLLRSAS